jgi:ATP-dependent DNA ligase
MFDEDRPLLTYLERYEILQEIFLTDINPSYKLVETYKATSHSEIISLRDTFIHEGYEGAMIRLPNGIYEHARSESLIKYKSFIDHEFEIIDIKKSKDEFAIFVCRTSDGGIFTATAHGTHEKKRMYLKNKNKYIGKFVNVEFPEYTESGLPSQPIAKYLREEQND